MKTYEVHFTVNLLHSIIKEGMLTVKANDPNDARVRGCSILYNVLQNKFKSAKNYDYAIWSVEECGEVIDAEVKEMNLIGI